ncbi:TolB family protein [Gracilimonas sp.]|uniref:TolB family protein n=1 Tax=Gracilimonas sp. TaxID=1974203 RepID=UPI003BAC10C8
MPEFEILNVQVSLNPVHAGDTVRFTVITDDSVKAPYGFEWKLEYENNEVNDTVTSSNQLVWNAPNENGSFRHEVWVSSESGEQVSDTYTFSVEVKKNSDSALSGDIVFSAKDQSGTFQIFRIDAVSSDFQQLTFFDIGEDATQPSWSPEGEKIIFTSNKYGISTGPALWTMNSDGSNQEVLYDPEPENEHVPPLIGEYPHWSPNGEKVLFQLCMNCQIISDYNIFTFNVTNKEVRQITYNQAIDIDPYWSPDGSKISFISDREYRESDSEDYYSDLYVIKHDAVKEKLTEKRHIRFPVWNSTTSEIAFTSISAPAGIYSIDLDNQEVSPIIENSSDRVQVIPHTWSADGEKILFSRLELDSPRNHTIYIFDKSRDSLYSIYNQIAPIGNPALDGADWFSQ